MTICCNRLTLDPITNQNPLRAGAEYNSFIGQQFWVSDILAQIKLKIKLFSWQLVQTCSSADSFPTSFTSQYWTVNPLKAQKIYETYRELLLLYVRKMMKKRQRKNRQYWVHPISSFRIFKGTFHILNTSLLLNQYQWTC